MMQRRRMLAAQFDKTNYFGTTTPTLTRGYFDVNGAYVYDGNYQCLNYFEVEASTSYTSEINLIYNDAVNYNPKDAFIYQIAVYDANKSFVSFLWNGTSERLDIRTFTIPSNGKYVRFCYRRKALTPLYQGFITWYACGLYKGTKSYLSEEI